MTGIRIENSEPDDAHVLHDIWYHAVEKTHHFLRDGELENLSPLVKSYLAHASLLIAVKQPRTILGFMGMTENRIDSLFISPEFFNQGVGRVFVNYAKSKFDHLLVDVNEQNDGAVAFYKRLGFTVTGRSETDDEGRPYPLLHMATA